MNAKDKVDQYISRHSAWTSVLEKLRLIIMETGLEEDFKWSQPVYMYEGKNIAGLGATKNYVGIWFFQGGLLKDAGKVLMNAQEGKTKTMRQWRFESERDLNKSLIRSYLKESIQNQKVGKVIKAVRGEKLMIPEFLQNAFKNDKVLQNAFAQLTLGKKRDFAEYIETAKQHSTKERRLKKIVPLILAGIGLNDKYK